jgi:single-strand DNA-binding protein
MSAPDVNQVVLVGRLTKDPQARQLKDGGSVCELRLAVNDQREREALVIDVATFGKQADACATYLKKGRQVAVAGRLVRDEWQNKDGQPRSRYLVIGKVSFGNDRSENGAGPDARDE